MQLRTVVFLLSVLLTVLLLTKPIQCDDDEDNKDDGGDEEEPPKSCYRYVINFANDGLKSALKCIANLKPKYLSEYLTRSYCILRCILTDLGSIDSEGRFDDIAAAFFFEENFAPEVQASLLPEVQGCFALAEQFEPKDYWCKTYAPFIQCVLRAVVAALIPYGGNCFTSPILATVLDALKYITPDPVINNNVEELRRMYKKSLEIKCLNQNCTRKYKIQKVNGVSTMILYDRNMTELSRTLKKPTSKSKDILI